MDWIEVFVIIGTTSTLMILFGGIAWVIRHHERVAKQKMNNVNMQV